jgi:hypothetical protein
VSETTKTTQISLDKELEGAVEAAWKIALEGRVDPGSHIERLMRHLYRMSVAVEMAKAAFPRMVSVPESVDLRGMRPGPAVFVRSPDLEAVFELYRLADRPCGIQVVGRDRVVCWIGDIQVTLAEPKWLAWGSHAAPSIFHETTIEGAAAWLRSQLEPEPLVSGRSSREIGR